MRNGASTYVTAQFVSSILASRPTRVGEVAETFAAVADTVARLLESATTVVAASPATAPQRAPRTAKPAPVQTVAKARVAKSATAAPLVVKPVPAKRVIAPPVAPSPEAPAVAVATPKRRGRPPRSAAAVVTVEPLEQETAAPASRLLRRHDVAATPAAPAADPFERDPRAETRIKGVVKWFDTRSNKGILRLTGMAGDVTLDAALLAKSKVKRLFKDQEVEVTGVFRDGKFEPRGLTVPGQPQESLVTNGQVLHAAGRQSRPVFVEVKRASPRLRSARAEAEHAFGRATKPVV